MNKKRCKHENIKASLSVIVLKNELSRKKNELCVRAMSWDIFIAPSFISFIRFYVRKPFSF